MGDVYLAYDSRMDREVAIKSLSARRDTSARSIRQFKKELRYGSRVRHAFVAPIYDVLEHDGTPLIVMERIEGTSLRDLLYEGPLEREVSLRYAAEIAEALHEIHRHGLVHRDLKPENVMIARDGHVRVLDFGLAGRDPASESTETLDSETLVDATGVAGTPAYMAPEQFQGAMSGARGDLFSLGVILCEMMTGEHPFRRNTLAATAVAIVQDPPFSSRSVRRNVENDPLGQVALKLLSKQPEQRYASARDLLWEFTELSGGLIEPTQVRSPPWVARAGWVSAVLVLLVGGLVWRGLWLGEPPPPRPVVAVLPVQVDAAGPTSDARLLEQLLVSHLDEQIGLRSIPMERVRDLQWKGDAEGIERLSGFLACEWLISSAYFTEDGERIQTVALYAADGHHEQNFVVRGSTVSELARRSAMRIAEIVAIGEETGSPPRETPSLMSTRDDALALYDRAGSLESESRYSEANTLLERAVALDPAFLRARWRRAELLRAIGYEADAQREIDIVDRAVKRLELDTTHPVSLELSATTARLHNNLNGTVKHLLDLNARFPDDPGVLRSLAAAEQERDRPTAAIEWLGKAEQLDPMDPAIQVLKSRSMARAGRLDEARAALARADELRELLGIETDRGGLLEAVAFIEMREGNYEAAFETYDRAEKAYLDEGLELKAISPLKSKGDAKMMLWQLAEARTYFDRSVALIEESGNHRLRTIVLNSYGAMLYRARELDDAAEILSRAEESAVEINNEGYRFSALSNAISVAVLRGETNRAAQMASQALKIAETREDTVSRLRVYERLADIEYFDGNLEQAHDYLNVVIRSDPSSPDVSARHRTARQKLVRLFLTQGRTTEALESAEHAVRLSDHPQAEGYSRALRSRVFSRLGRGADAREDLRATEAMLSESKGPVLRHALLLARVELLRFDQGYSQIVELLDFEFDTPSFELAETVPLRIEALRKIGRIEDARAFAEQMDSALWLPTPQRREIHQDANRLEEVQL